MGDAWVSVCVWFAPAANGLTLGAGGPRGPLESEILVHGTVSDFVATKHRSRRCPTENYGPCAKAERGAELSPGERGADAVDLGLFPHSQLGQPKPLALSDSGLGVRVSIPIALPPPGMRNEAPLPT